MKVRLNKSIFLVKNNFIAFLKAVIMPSFSALVPSFSIFSIEFRTFRSFRLSVARNITPIIATPINTPKTNCRVLKSMWDLPWNWKYTKRLPKNMLKLIRSHVMRHLFPARVFAYIYLAWSIAQKMPEFLEIVVESLQLDRYVPWPVLWIELNFIDHLTCLQS